MTIRLICRTNLIAVFLLMLLAGALAMPTKSYSQTTDKTPSSIEQTDAPAITSNLVDNRKLVIQTENGTHLFDIELALDDKARMKGLMYRTKLGVNQGMLFDFEETGPVDMWMKNTYVSLDMLFVQEDGTVSHLVHSTTPLSLSIIGSGGPVRYVLEIKGGTAKRLSIKVGDQLMHQLFTPN